MIVWQGSVWTLDRLLWIDLALGPAVACLLIGLATGHPAALVRPLEARPIRNLGSSSYSLYLTHGPIVVVVYETLVAGRVRQGVPAFALTLVLAVPLTIVFARVFASVFEAPFRRDHRSHAHPARRAPAEDRAPRRRYETLTPPPGAAAMEPYFDLGTYTRGTSTASTSAQTWFDRGLVWSYAFHHEEAIRCFERAVEHDPGFALAHWGIAYAIGPNYNKQWEAFDPVDLAASLEKACDEVAAARACADRAAPVERALVEALGSRYQANDPSADLVAWNADYAEAMRDVYRAHPDDLDVAALFADALMNLTPWALWDRYTGLPSEGAATLEAKEVLERALERPGGRAHPGLAAPLRAPDGDVAVPRAGAAGRRRAALARPRRRPPRAHADAHRRAVRRLQEHARVEPARDRGQREVRRARGPGRVLRALPRARPPLRDLRGDVPRPVAGRAARRRRPRGLAARGAAADRAAADGRLPRGVRPHAPARAHPLRDVGGHPRAAAARRPRSSTAPRRR